MRLQTFKTHAEAAFQRYGRGVVRLRWAVAALLLALTAALGSQVTHIRMETDTESFFHEEDPALIAYNAFRDQFGRDEVILIGIDPPEVFDAAFLERLRAFQADLRAEVPYLDDVTSLLTVRNTRGEGESLVVEDLVEEIPTTPEGMAALRERTLNSRLYPNFVVSPQGDFTAVVLETLAYSPGEQEDLMAGFDAGLGGLGGESGPPAERSLLSNEENAAVVAAVRRVMARHEGPDFPLHLTGSPVVTDQLKQAMQTNMQRFVALSMAAIGVFLLVLFRRLSGTLLALLVVSLSVISTVGLMAVLDVPFKLPQMVLPSFLLAVGVATSVHLLVIFFRHLSAHDSRHDAVAYALGHSGLPIAMTSLTTAAGLASFGTAQMAAVAELGVFAAAGVLLSLVYALALLPALLALLPLPRGRAGTGRAPLADRLLTGVGDFATGRPRTIVLAAAALVLVAAAGLPRVQFSHNTLAWFPATNPLRQATELIDEKFAGSMSVEVVVDTGEENGLYSPALLRDIDALAQWAEQYRGPDGRTFVGKTQSVVDILKETHQALNENRPEFYAIPDSRELVAQELLLFENSGAEELEPLVDPQFSQARLTLRVPWQDAAYYVGFVDALQARAQQVLGDRAEVRVTGLIKLFAETIYLLMQSMATSYSIAFVVITAFMILVLGSVRTGLLAMIPSLAPIVLTLGWMGWTGIRLDAFTLLVGSIALGLAVDDTIHFFHNFERYRVQYGRTLPAVHETLLGTGRAMLFTSLVLVTGFWLYMLGTLNNLYYFGLLTGMTLVLALLAVFLLAPAMMRLLHGRADEAAGVEAAPRAAD